MNNKKIKLQLLGFIFIVSMTTFTLTSCTKMESSSEPVTVEKVIKPISVNAARVVRGSIDSSINVGGSVASGNPVAIIGEATGTLKEFSLEVGDSVKKDEVIAKIDPSRPGMEYKMKEVKAPIDGTVVRVSVENGSLSSPSVPLAYIENLEDLSIKVRIIEKYISLLRLGETVELTFDAYPSQTFNGRVTKKDPTVDISTRTLGVTIEFDDDENLILPGMYAKCRIITSTENDALLIPSTSVFVGDNDTYVYVIENDKILRTPIVKGLETYDNVQVVSGISEDDVIVNTKSSLLADGSSIVVKNQGAY